MNKEENFASDSDESDEDFCPDKDNNSDAPPSEEESDDPISENDDEPATKKSTKKTSMKKRWKVAKIAPQQPTPEKEYVVSTRNRVETATKSKLEKDELESDDEDASRKDALWADFLSDVAPITQKPVHSRTTREATTSVPEKRKERANVSTPDVPEEPKKVVITEIFDFAGEEVRVEKTVSAESLKENGSKNVPSQKIGSESARSSVKRPGGGGGLGSILGQIGKKKKISVLEKTKIDWDSFKTTEGIEEELQTFNKGKDGYLQRQDFLERTDLRQFEIEKSVRQSRRKPM